MSKLPIVKVGWTVTLLRYPSPHHRNHQVLVRSIDLKKNTIWISNINMPYQGTISKILTRAQFEKETGFTF